MYTIRVKVNIYLCTYMHTAYLFFFGTVTEPVRAAMRPNHVAGSQLMRPSILGSTCHHHAQVCINIHADAHECSWVLFCNVPKLVHI